MALNFSHCPIFPVHLSEDNLVSPMRITNNYIAEGIPENNKEIFGKSWDCGREVDGCFDYGMDICPGSMQDPVSRDILDLLPADPFGMDISTTFTAITGWLEDLEVDYAGFVSDGNGASEGDLELYARLNFIWRNALKFQAFPESTWLVQKPDVMCSYGCLDGKEAGDETCQCDSGSVSMDGILSSPPDNPSNCWGQPSSDYFQEQKHSYLLVDGGAPHEALNFALDYLGVQDLLAVERVCKSLHSRVRGDPFVWRNIHIGQPLNEKITDDIILQLTNRAQGCLQCLSLVECARITDDGLKRVLENNPRLTKLSVPGCTRLSIEGVISNLKAFNSMGTQGVKHLRIGGLYGVTLKHFEELKSLMGSECYHKQQNSSYKPHFYLRGNFYVSCDDDRAIDIEMCPICQNLRLVYDCPMKGCQHATEACRACTLCILRCVQCGRCISDNEYEETFCLELLCLDCWEPSMTCEERQDWEVQSTPSVFVGQDHSFYLHG